MMWSYEVFYVVNWTSCGTNCGVANNVIRIKSHCTIMSHRLNWIAEYTSHVHLPACHQYQLSRPCMLIGPPANLPIHLPVRPSLNSLLPMHVCAVSLEEVSHLLLAGTTSNKFKYDHDSPWSHIAHALWEVFCDLYFLEINYCPNDLGCLFRHNVWLFSKKPIGSLKHIKSKLNQYLNAGEENRNRKCCATYCSNS